MNTAKSYKSAAAQIKATNFSASITAFEEAKRQRAEIQSAIVRGEESIAAAIRELSEVRAGVKIDANEAADAMMAGGTVILKTKSETALQADIDGLRTGVTRLRERADEARSAEACLNSAAVNELARCFDGLPEALGEEARKGVAALSVLFASATALASASRNGIDLADKLKRIMEVCYSSGLINSGPFKVDGDMANLLRSASEPINKLGLSWSDSANVR
jgi:hypothetical protein